MEPEYDWNTCVTAAELRSRGYKLPDEIPDPAWVPNSSIQITVSPPTMDIETGIMHFKSVVTYAVPFQCFKVEFIMKEAGSWAGQLTSDERDLPDF